MVCRRSRIEAWPPWHVVKPLFKPCSLPSIWCSLAGEYLRVLVLSVRIRTRNKIRVCLLWEMLTAASRIYKSVNVLPLLEVGLISYFFW